MISHIKYRQMKVRKTKRMRGSAWCGYQADIGRILTIPYRHLKTRVPLVNLVFKAYSASFLPQLQPREALLEQDLAALATCPACRQAFARRMPIASPETQRKQASRG